MKAFSITAALAAFALVSAIAPATVRADAAKPVLRAGLTLEVSTLDPARATNYGENIIVLNVYDMLVMPMPDNTVVPWIAKSWDVSDDRKTYTFHLRDDVLFHDGKPVEADDIAFSMRRVLTLPGLVGGYLRNVDKDKIEVVDPRTVRFNLKEVDPTFIRALVNLKILNGKLLMANKAEGQYGEFGDYGVKYLQSKDAGSGPYYIADFKAGEGITLKAFEGYKLRPFEPGAPVEVKLRIIPEIVTLENKMLAGEFDVSLVSPSPPRVKIFADNPKFAVDQWPTLNNYYVVMNTTKPPLDDVNVRKAISHAFDASTAMNKIYSGGIRLKGPVPEALLGKCEGIATYEYDMKKAAEYIAKSKYSADDLKKFKLEYASTAGSEPFEKVGLLLTLNLKRIGLNAEVKTVRWTDIVAAQTKPESAYPFVFFYDSARVRHPSPLLSFYTKKGWGAPYPSGGIYWENPEVTALMDKASLLPDGAPEQYALYCEAQKKIAAEAPAIFAHNDIRVQPRWKYLVKAAKQDGGSSQYEYRFETFRFDTKDPDFVANQSK
ncbi:ABC transporter substrate-binding protein [Reyranella soli]|uniref:Peptide ABC transporter substrate-binding protein n=1 Tax=Reyranella soli TaxID=1230389 RepID=A0A512NKX3_9HYPH|nr:ABC transporter substrate-binding protein [Reyranella soli]GEP59597.1 peptide ABC transporter substrate-binding protein [Reyranella soli]